jgi:4-hydroxy-tetrahydrodipicolinate synthase
MTASVSRFRGVMSPVLTPFNADLTPSPTRFVKHCRWLLNQEVGLAIFGTNSEANSLSVKEKLTLLEALLTASLPASKMVPGTGTCALPDTIELTRHAVNAGCAGVLMLPPFYYKPVSDEGLFRSFARVIDAVADDRLRIYLYHIPPVSQVPITLTLIERLLKAFPGIIAGVKDSSGDWDNTVRFLDAFATSGFGMFVGSESFLVRGMGKGAVGTISAVANVNPAAIDRTWRGWQGPEAEALQKGLDDVRKALAVRPTMISALKACIARFGKMPGWARVRPPLTPLSEAESATLFASLSAIRFAMPGLTESQPVSA